MSIVSIGEVVGEVKGGPSESGPFPLEQVRPEEESRPDEAQLEQLERELKARAWRRTRLHAD
jgi:hypothetical protein